MNRSGHEQPPPLEEGDLHLLSVVMPVFNESETLERAVRRVLGADTLGLEVELLLVDDGSTDGSDEIADRLAREDERVRVFHQERNRGKGAALRRAFTEVRGDVVLIQDADLEYDTADYPLLLGPILDGSADVVFGSRFMSSQVRRVLFFWHSLGNQFITLVSNMVNDLTFTDIETCYKAMRRDVLNRIRLREDRFGFEPEITAKLARLRPQVRIFEVGIRYFGRTYAEGKKIGWKDGVAALWCILKYRFFD